MLEQSIAVFGESGSGKTVMVSSFYGAAQEPTFLRESLFHVVADSAGEGSRLHRNYLGMRNSAKAPEPTRFTATPYSFRIQLKDATDPKAAKARPFDALRLVWHDYPGEWFEQDVSGPEEAALRVDTFRNLLGSDVALLLVDGQRLLDNAGEEERYLKSLFANFRNGLLALKGDLLTNGKPLVEFPRIWVIALSKADLLPGTDVFAFRDLLIEKSGEDIEQLREVLAGMVESSEALSVGEDFLLTSSAKFTPDAIEVTERVGLDLVLPIAATLPLERHVRWSKTFQLPVKVAESLLGNLGPVAQIVMATKVKLPGVWGVALTGALALVGKDRLDKAAGLAGEHLAKLNADALAKHNYLTAVLTRFRMDLDEAEAASVLSRSRR